MLEVILPAAGYATRLWPLTKNKPKALLEVAGKPIIEHIFDRLEALPIARVSIVTNAKFYRNFLEWNSGFKFKSEVNILNDGTTSNEGRLGAIGDINFAIEKQGIAGNNADLLIINADNLFTFDLTRAYKFFKDKNADTIVLYDVRTKEEASKHGVPEIDENFRVVGFEEKPSEPKSTLCSVGIYFYTPGT
ncbi:MAG: nucleotidyltransferase family protein, partial [Candidatus Diapherotrites archaeon]|nr:nucleotidyltransferase family protein [Candidatus Diapherotrites archaeon]